MPFNAKKLASMARKKMSGTDTETVLLVGGGLLFLFLMMRKPTTPYYPPGTYPPGTYPPGTILPPGNTSTNTAISAGASVVNNLINQIFG